MMKLLIEEGRRAPFQKNSVCHHPSKERGSDRHFSVE